jgi:hypothetical protein
MALPPKILLLTVEYIKAYSPINAAVDANLLYPSVYVAQDMQIAPWLGDALYLKIKTDVGNQTIAGVYETLLDEYIRPALLWYVILEALPALTFKIDNGSIVQRLSDDTSPAGDTVMKEMRMNALQKAEYYGIRLGEYLCANSASYPEYSANVSPQRCPRSPYKTTLNYGFSRSVSATALNYPIKRVSQLP